MSELVGESEATITHGPSSILLRSLLFDSLPHELIGHCCDGAEFVREDVLIQRESKYSLSATAFTSHMLLLGASAEVCAAAQQTGMHNSNLMQMVISAPSPRMSRLRSSHYIPPAWI